MDPEIGHCGPPLESAMIKLVDIPEMGYFSKDSKGEVSIQLYAVGIRIQFSSFLRYAVRVQRLLKDILNYQIKQLK